MTKTKLIDLIAPAALLAIAASAHVQTLQKAGSIELDTGWKLGAGGTGKYKCISDRGPRKCKPIGNNGEVQCAQRLGYKLR